MSHSVKNGGCDWLYLGKRCELAYVKEISEVTAQMKNYSLEELSKATCATAQEFLENFLMLARG